MNVVAIVLSLIAGCNQPVFVQQKAVVASPVVAYPQLYYSYTVGQSQALQERVSLLETVVANQQTLSEQIVQLQMQQVSLTQPAVNPIEAKALEIVRANCVSCHQGGDAKGGLDLTGAIDTATKISVMDEVVSGRMPPAPKEPLSDEDARVIAQWVNQDQGVKDLMKRAKESLRATKD